MSAVAVDPIAVPIAAAADRTALSSYDGERLRTELRRSRPDRTPPVVSFSGVEQCDLAFVQLGLAEPSAREWSQHRRLLWTVDVSACFRPQLDLHLRTCGLMMIDEDGGLLGADQGSKEALEVAQTLGPTFSTAELARGLSLSRLTTQSRLFSLRAVGMVEATKRQRWRLR